MTSKHVHPFDRLILMLNTLGFCAYLLWLVIETKDLLFRQDAVLYFLPALVFIFIYIMLFRPVPGKGSGRSTEKTSPEGRRGDR